MYGFEKNIPHLDDHLVSLKRTEVTQPEYIDEIRGEGLPIVDEDGDFTGRYGSLFVKYTVKLPKIAPKDSFKTELESMSRPTPEYDEL